jgi:hypothetical protein
MSDNTKTLDSLRKSALAGLATPPQIQVDLEHDSEEDCCPAFGFLRGVRDRGLAIEFRFRTGNRVWLPYSWLGPVHYDPSAGLLLRFAGDTITLVLIRGSNLDTPVLHGSMNLTDRGIQRYRITFVREMDEDELRRAGNGETTVDAIHAAEFETTQEVRDWLRLHAPAFAPKDGGK